MAKKSKERPLYKVVNKITQNVLYLSAAGVEALGDSQKERNKYDFDLETKYYKIKEEYYTQSELEAIRIKIPNKVEAGKIPANSISEPASAKKTTKSNELLSNV